MKRLFLILSAVLLACATLSAQNMQRDIPRQAKTRNAAVEAQLARYDTIVPDSGQVVVAGFEKPLREVRETMFVTNLLPCEICAITLQIIYFDTQNRQLHQAEHSDWVDIPSGQTRRIEVKSFDRSRLFYYHKTALTGRPKQATPFKVEIKVLNTTHLKNSKQ